MCACGTAPIRAAFPSLSHFTANWLLELFAEFSKTPASQWKNSVRLCEIAACNASGLTLLVAQRVLLPAPMAIR